MTKQRFYTKDYARQWAILEEKRLAAGVTCEQWQAKSLLGHKAFWNIRRTRRAFPAKFKMYSRALSALIKQKNQTKILELIDA